MKPNVSVTPFSRRRFLSRSALWTTPSLLTPWPSWARSDEAESKPLRFGIIADVHKDIIHDADRRLRTFVKHMTEEKVDFIIQLGDFCIPKEANAGFLDIWNAFPGPRYHVLGNHDMDGGFKQEETAALWKMPGRFYSVDRGGIHFVILDGNDRPANHGGGYPRFIAEDQLQWLAADLEQTSLPVMVFVHQSIERENAGGVQNGAAVRKVLEDANQAAGKRKIVACFSGHHHRDYVRTIRDIAYAQINSASYHWVGSRYQHVRYSADIDRRFPSLKNTVPYKDPLYAIVTVDQGKGNVTIQGRQSEFVGPAPWELGGNKASWDADTLTPGIADRAIAW